MTYDKAMFVLLSGVCVMLFLILCIVGKLFYLKNLAVTLVIYQIFLLGYSVVVSLTKQKDQKSAQM